MTDAPSSYEVNRRMWDERAPAHAASPGYRRQLLLDDPTRLSHVVAFDRPRLGDLTGLDVVHLQCHIGTDTLSLARLGARVSGLDFSEASLEQARDLAQRAGTDIEYVHGDLYDAPDLLGRERFDLVYTGIGALCWLPRIRPWAEVVAELLRPGGRLFIREKHPVLWALDYERDDELLVLAYPYRETEEPIVEESPGSYVATEGRFTHTVSHTWNHGLGEIVTALLDAGMALTGLVEHQTAPSQAVPRGMAELTEGEWGLTERPDRLPCTYTLQAIKRARS